jgi:uncharacterized protein (DUF4415 family)
MAREQLKNMTDEEDRVLTAAAESDPDNLPADELFKRRGRPPLDNPKMAVKLRLDPDVVAHFKSGGPGWQTRINETLRRSLKRRAG